MCNLESIDEGVGRSLLQHAEGTKPWVTFDKKTGVIDIYVNRTNSTGPGWMTPDMRKIFPSADAIFKEQGIN